MSKESISVGHYELRRQARKPEPEAMKRGAWKRRLAVGTAVATLVVAVGVGLWLNWRLRRVPTVKASVSASLLSLSSDIDARLKELYVEPTDQVKAGQAVARLDDSEAQAMLEASEATLQIRESAWARAQAQLRLTSETVHAEIALDTARVDAAAARVESAQNDLDLRATRVDEEIRAAQASYEEASARLEMTKKGERAEIIQSIREKLAAARALREFRVYEVAQLETLFKEGVVSDYNLQTKKTDLIAQENAVRQAELDLERVLTGATEEEIEIANQAMAAREAALALAKTATDQLKSLTATLHIRRAEMREAEAQLQSTQARLAEIDLARESVRAAEAELTRARAETAARRATLERMLIKSPVAGVVTRTFVDEGELCRKGAACVQIAEADEGVWIEGYIRESDAVYVKEGQPARVEIVLGSGEYIDATVDAIALATSSMDNADPTGAAAGTSATGGELVWVKLEPTEEMHSPLPGMTAHAWIRVR